MSRDPRVVVVTGASSGIGLATALEAARQGDHVVLVARGVSALDEAAEQCRAAGAASADVRPTDVVESDAVEALFDDVRATHGQVDAVVHCAGVVAYGRFEDVPAYVFDRVLATNVLGTANVARAVLPHMRERDHGTLVLIGSVIGHIAAPLMTAYAVSKWGIRALARQLQVENRDRSGVHIGYVSPGGVDTPIYLQAGNYLGRVGRPPPPVVSPERVARAALRQLEHPRPRVQVGASNRLIMAGFTALPAVFDLLVTPLFDVAATDQRRPVDAGPGNVLSSSPAGNRLHGEQGSSVRAIVSAVAAKLPGRT